MGPCRARIVECLKTTPEGAERVDRRSEVLNEALAKEVPQRKLREMSEDEQKSEVQQESKDVPIPSDSDPRKRRAIKAATATASSSCEQQQLADGRQPCNCGDADTAKFVGRWVKNGRTADDE